MMNDATPNPQGEPPSSSQSDPILHPPAIRRGAGVALGCFSPAWC